MLVSRSRQGAPIVEDIRALKYSRTWMTMLEEIDDSVGYVELELRKDT